jgi:hypothetical protein
MEIFFHIFSNYAYEKGDYWKKPCYTSVKHLWKRWKNQLSQLLCPVCGRLLSLKHFNLSDFDREIYAVQVVGLGRGRGVKVTGKHSILQNDDPTVQLIKDRILELSNLLLEHGCLERKEIISKTGLESTDPEEIGKRDALIADLSGEITSLNKLVDDQVERLNHKDALISELSEKNINQTTNINSLKKTINKGNQIIENLSEEIVSLKSKTDELESEVEDWQEKYNHRTDQARKLYRIAEQQEEKIRKLDEEIEDLGEELIG